MIRYLNRNDISKLVNKLALKYEGFFQATEDNISNNNSFEYLLEAPYSKYFGTERYPTIFEKAACYTFFIIKDHIFFDGNKRMGMRAGILFLRLNGWNIKKSIPLEKLNEDIKDLAVKIANDEITLPQIADFYKKIMDEV